MGIESNIKKLDPFKKSDDNKILIKKLNSDAVIPKYNLAGDAGFDLSSVQDYIVLPGQTVLVDTGLAFELPPNKVLLVCPRSGVSLKTNLRIANAPGVVDSNFRDSVRIIITNIGHTPHFVKKGDRLAQGLIQTIDVVEFVEVEELSDSERNKNGFGSSGV
jgi:dUTP pyrophosphatase